MAATGQVRLAVVSRMGSLGRYDLGYADALRRMAEKVVDRA